MITITDLTEKDRGRWVVYRPEVGRPKIGKIKSWNDSYIFVVYHIITCDNMWHNYHFYTAAATSAEELEFLFSYVRERIDCPGYTQAHNTVYATVPPKSGRIAQ